MTEAVATVCGVEIRTCDAYPRDVVGFSNGRMVVYYWGGAEVARLQSPSTAGAEGEQGLEERT